MLATDLDTQVMPDFMTKLLKQSDEQVISGVVALPSSLLTTEETPAIAAVSAVVQALPAPTTPLTMKMVHRMIMDSYIASAHVLKKPKFPQLRANTSFDNVGFPGETAATLNKALRCGGRGLGKTRQYREWIDSLPYGTPPTMKNYIQFELADKASFVMFVRRTLNELKKLSRRK